MSAGITTYFFQVFILLKISNGTAARLTGILHFCTVLPKCGLQDLQGT